LNDKLKICKGYSVLEVIKSLAKIVKKEIDFQMLPRRAVDKATYLADIQNTIENLDWRAKESSDEIIKGHWNWQQKNSNK
jgi:UDP-glucose 4-epimerase